MTDFRSLLEIDKKDVPFSFAAVVKDPRRPGGFIYRERIRLRFPSGQASVLAKGKFVDSDNMLREQTFYSRGGRVFASRLPKQGLFQTESPVYNLSDLEQVLDWRMEPHSGADAHPLLSIIRPDEQGLDVMGRLCPPFWAIGKGSPEHAGEFWQVSPLYRQLAMLREQASFPKRAMPQFPQRPRHLVWDDSIKVQTTVQQMVDDHCLLIDDILHYAVPEPCIRVSVSGAADNNVLLSFVGGPHIPPNMMDHTVLFFRLDEYDRARKVAEDISRLAGVEIDQAGQLDFLDVDGLTFDADRASKLACARNFHILMARALYWLPDAAVEGFLSLVRHGEPFEEIDDPVALTSTQEELPIDEGLMQWRETWLRMMDQVGGSFICRDGDPESFKAFVLACWATEWAMGSGFPHPRKMALQLHPWLSEETIQILSLSQPLFLQGGREMVNAWLELRRARDDQARLEALVDLYDIDDITFPPEVETLREKVLDPLISEEIDRIEDRIEAAKEVDDENGGPEFD